MKTGASQPAVPESAASRKEVYITIAGNVDTGMVQRIFNGIAVAVNNRVDTIHMLLQSNGGLIGDGVGLYNYLRNVPITLIAYNGGTVASSA